MIDLAVSAQDWRELQSPNLVEHRVSHRMLNDSAAVGQNAPIRHRSNHQVGNHLRGFLTLDAIALHRSSRLSENHGHSLRSATARHHRRAVGVLRLVKRTSGEHCVFLNLTSFRACREISRRSDVNTVPVSQSDYPSSVGEAATPPKWRLPG